MNRESVRLRKEAAVTRVPMAWADDSGYTDGASYCHSTRKIGAMLLGNQRGRRTVANCHWEVISGRPDAKRCRLILIAVDTPADNHYSKFARYILKSKDLAQPFPSERVRSKGVVCPAGVQSYQSLARDILAAELGLAAAPRGSASCQSTVVFPELECPSAARFFTPV